MSQHPTTAIHPWPYSVDATPWAVYCRDHRRVYLTHDEYVRQLEEPDQTWQCPMPDCKAFALWDEDNHEEWTELIEDATYGAEVEQS